MLPVNSPRRYLEKLLYENKSYLGECVLNVGGGKSPYRELCSTMINVDMVKYSGVDVICDAAKLPFKQKFDSVICTQLLEHVSEPSLVVDGIYHSLTAGGTLLLSVPFLERYHPDPQDYWRFTEEGLKKLLERKFEIIKLIPIGGRFLWILYFMELHSRLLFPSILIKLLHPIFSRIEKLEKNKKNWTLVFL